MIIAIASIIIMIIINFTLAHCFYKIMNKIEDENELQGQTTD